MFRDSCGGKEGGGSARTLRTQVPTVGPEGRPTPSFCSSDVASDANPDESPDGRLAPWGRPPAAACSSPARCGEEDNAGAVDAALLPCNVPPGCAKKD
jgi:hypothetical protein